MNNGTTPKLTVPSPDSVVEPDVDGEEQGTTPTKFAPAVVDTFPTLAPRTVLAAMLREGVKRSAGVPGDSVFTTEVTTARLIDSWYKEWQ